MRILNKRLTTRFTSFVYTRNIKKTNTIVVNNYSTDVNTNITEELEFIILTLS